MIAGYNSYGCDDCGQKGKGARWVCQSCRADFCFGCPASGADGEGADGEGADGEGADGESADGEGGTSAEAETAQSARFQRFLSLYCDKPKQGGASAGEEAEAEAAEAEEVRELFEMVRSMNGAEAEGDETVNEQIAQETSEVVLEHCAVHD